MCATAGAFVCETDRERQTERRSEAISSLYFLDIQKAGFVCAPTPLPLPRQGNRGGIIASEVQKYRGCNLGGG